MKTVSIFVFLVSVLIGMTTTAQNMSISYPMDRAVFQRCEYGNTRATISIPRAYIITSCLVRRCVGNSKAGYRFYDEKICDYQPES